MRGILAHGTYVPYHRLQRSKVTEALGSGGGRGTRSVASHDEDTTTMGLEAARRCLRSTDVEPQLITFATADPAYIDKTNANGIHAALNLPRSVGAYDLNGAVKSGQAALMAAYGARGPALAVLSDIRIGLPGGNDESEGGDGAAAILFGDDTDGPVIAEVVAVSSATAEFLDRWRTPGDPTSKAWEERFAEFEYVPLANEAVADALKQVDLTPDQVDHVIVTGTSSRSARTVSNGLGVDPSKFADGMANTVGNTGTAHIGMMTSSVLDGAEPGKTVLVVQVSDGATAVVLRTTDAIAGYQSADPIAEQVAAGNDGLSYQTYLTWRGFLRREPPRRPDPDRPAAPPSARREGWKFGLIGSKDRSSGAVHLPPMRVSMVGGTVDDMEPIRMAETQAVIATFTVDRLAFSLSPPVVAAVVDFDGGGRFQCEMTDVDPAEVAIGQRVEMTFRKLYTADGVHNYFWKAKPVR